MLGADQEVKWSGGACVYWPAFVVACRLGCVGFDFYAHKNVFTVRLPCCVYLLKYAKCWLLFASCRTLYSQIIRIATFYRRFKSPAVFAWQLSILDVNLLRLLRRFEMSI